MNPRSLHCGLRRWLLCAGSALALMSFRGSAAETSPAGAMPPPPFEADIRAFREMDRTNAPTPGGILFVGSSIFRQWTNVTSAMAPLPVVNRAFGGSRTADQLLRFDAVVVPWAPRLVVYYCGSNDLKAGEPPEAIFGRFREFDERLRRDFSTTRLVFVSATRSPDREPMWDRVDDYNRRVREHCLATPGRTFVDVNPLLFDAAGRPRLELYQPDRLHLLPAAYAEFARVLRPVVAREAEAAGIGR